MILHMAVWLNEQGYPTDRTNAGRVIWAIDRHYPGGFHRFAAGLVGRLSSATQN
jgi:hypothetical protein